MKGSVTKYKIKGSSRPRWRYRIFAGKDANGRKLYQGAGGFEKEGDADTAMRKHMGRLRVGKEATPSERIETPRWTLGTWVQNWLDTYGSKRCQLKTLERYRELAEYVTLPERTLAAVDLRELH